MHDFASPEMQGWISTVAVGLPLLVTTGLISLGVAYLRRIRRRVEDTSMRVGGIQAQLTLIHDATNSRLHGIEAELHATQGQLHTALRIADAAETARLALVAALTRREEGPRRPYQRKAWLPVENINAGQRSEELLKQQMLAWEVAQLKETIENLTQRQSVKNGIPWLVPALFSLLLTGAIGYIGIVHQMVIHNTGRIDTLAAEQQRRTHLEPELDDVRRRLAVVESSDRTIPYLLKELNDLTAKVERILMRPTRWEDDKK